MAIPPATAYETDVNTLRERINYLRGDNESLRERVAELLAYNQTRTDEIAASVAQVSELQTKHQVACDTIERQRADIDTIRGYLDEMKKSCERTAQQRDGLLTDLLEIRLLASYERGTEDANIHELARAAIEKVKS